MADNLIAFFIVLVMNSFRKEIAYIVIHLFPLNYHVHLNGTITYKPHRQQRRKRAQAHNSTPYRHQQSFM
jgi:hypothetical protein